MSKALGIGIVGLGTVGQGVYQLLRDNKDTLERRLGRTIELKAVKVRRPDHARTLLMENSQITITTELQTLLNDPNIDVIVELIGGVETAYSYIQAAIAAGKHVVTANKACLAHHGGAIFQSAQEAGVMVGFEAAIAAGIPIVKTVRESLASNDITAIAGIINGTTNYILSCMTRDGMDFAQALAQAQAYGYAEADPSFDIDGVDAAHKIALLAAIAFGSAIQFDNAYIEGLRHLDVCDITYARQLGYRIKLLAIAKKREQGYELRIHPTLINSECLLADVEGAMNAVQVTSDPLGVSLYYGQGAGAQPTASAVVADIIDIGRLCSTEHTERVPSLGYVNGFASLRVLPIDETLSRFYLRMRVHDQAGVLADIAGCLAQESISIEAMIQHEPTANEATVDIVMLTDAALHGAICRAIDRINQLPTVTTDAVKLHLEQVTQ